MIQDLQNFKRWNRLVGWGVFAIAALTYLLTIEPSSSLWDCGEFIATSYKLEVGHPPGAPLFMLLARIATMFAPSPEYVPHMVNGMNALVSAFCILFMFWSVTHIARRLVTRNGGLLNSSNTIAILGAGAVGALAYTFTDTFWFSAVEGEVYAMSSMFTALVVWLMLRWEEEADEPHSARWIILIAYLMGLSIGVHILNLLTIPALVFIYYFRKYSKVTLTGLLLASLLAGALLYLINGVIIPYTVAVGAKVDIFCVNKWSWPVNSGMILFALAVFGLLGTAIYVTHRKGLRILNLLAMCVTMIMLGFASYASVTIRASVNPPMNSNNPDNPAALLSMLNRDQYGNRPLLKGPSYASRPIDYVYKDVDYYNAETGKYETHKVLDDYVYSEKETHFFPRMWFQNSQRDYEQWAKDNVGDEYGQVIHRKYYDYNDEKDKVKEVREPRFQDNLHFFFSYQLGHMYWRYFMWNFVGRQDDIQANGSSSIVNGNWLSGIDAIDSHFLGPQENLPREMAENKARNTYYFLPFLLGLLGLIYQLYRDPRNFIVVMWLFVMMGIALVVYFNITPGQPRERDYIYAGSFYAFSMWIGLGVLALYHLFSWLWKKGRTTAAIAAVAVSMVVPGILCAENWDDHDRSHRTIARDIGYNYLSSIVEKEGVSPIIINYGDNDTFPLWYNQEVDGVRPDVRIMNSSYLGGDWYVDEMKCKANDADGIPFSLPREKYIADNNAYIYIIPEKECDSAKGVMEFVRRNDKESKRDLMGDGTLMDYIPTQRITLPVNKENVIASGIVAEKDRDLIEDSITLNISTDALERPSLMVLDLLAHFDWKRPIYFTHARSQVVIDLGLLDYMQFDGYAYRLVPIKTKYNHSEPNKIGRIDAAYAYDKLMNVFRYGNLADSRVYVDEFIQNSIAAARAREAFARVALEYIDIARDENRLAKEGISQEECFARAEKLLDRGLQVLPINQIRYTESNITPFIKGYYLLALDEKGDALLKAYRDNLKEYINYYKQFPGESADLVSDVLNEKIGELTSLRETFARVALEYINIAWDENRLAKESISQEECFARAEKLLDRGLQMLPVNQIRYTESNTIPFIECYYLLALDDKGDALLKAYSNNLKEYINYYKQFEGEYADMVADVLNEKIGELTSLAVLASDFGREERAAEIVNYYDTLRTWYSIDNIIISNYNLKNYEAADKLLSEYVGKVIDVIDANLDSRDKQVREHISKKLGELIELGEIAITYNYEKGACEVMEYLYKLSCDDYADELLAKYISDIVSRMEKVQTQENTPQREDQIISDMETLHKLYKLAHKYKREDIAYYLNQYFRTLGAKDEDLILTEREKEERGIVETAN